MGERKPIFEPKSGVLTLTYEPGERVAELLENPPRFSWMPAAADDLNYVLEVSDDPEFAASPVRYGPLPYNFFTPPASYAPGTYYWRYAYVTSDELGLSAWSQVRSFTISADDELPETPLAPRESRFPHGTERPRLWLNGEQGVREFRERLAQDDDYCGWRIFMAKSVRPWLERALIAEPLPYPENKRVAKLWRQMYMDCQETLYAIRHLSVAGVILQDAELIAAARRWLLHAAAWDPDGTTSRDYNDEAAFRIAGALAWGYDWLYAELSADERQLVLGSLARRTKQVAFHVIERSRIHHAPYDSHAVRSLSSVLTPCCIALLGECDEAESWLHYTVEYLSGLYSPWGGKDGGWAEGPMYWTTGMAYVTEAMNLLRAFCGIDLYLRPFFRRTGDFPLYCFPPGTVRASFGDQSVLGDPPGLKTAYNMRQFAGITGNRSYQWYFEQVQKSDTDPDSKFYNYGWWDFRFDDLMFGHHYEAPERASVPEYEPLKWFRDVGWVAFHHRMENPDEHVMLLTKSSRYGSASHSHGDQNAFLLHAYGEPLAIESGYYVAFGSTMHRNWRRQTKSVNSLLIDGHGQYAGEDKSLCLAAVGSVEAAEHHAGDGPGWSYSRCDATKAYLHHVPDLQRYVRELYVVGGTYIVIVDTVDCAQPAAVDWLFHSLHQPELRKNAFRISGVKADLDARFVYVSSGGSVQLTQSDQFEDVLDSEIEGLPKQWHLKASAAPARSHRIVSLLVPMKKGEARYVHHLVDDQDHGVNLYFTDEGYTKRVFVPKAY